ncbi:MAG: glycosyltransferase family 2 protein [Oscillospiraceae bacterium]
MPKISVIICVFNGEKHLKRAVESCANQTLSDIEIVLVDDGSSDNSGKICDEFQKSDSRICAVHIENSGLSAARNKGMSVACGEFITFCDADDFIDKDAFEMMFREINKNESDIVICGYYGDIEKNGQIISTTKVCPEYAVADEKKEFLKQFVAIKSNHIFDASWNKLYRANIIKENVLQMPVGEIFEDTKFVLDFLNCTSKITVLNRCFYHYIQRMGSITKSYNPSKLICLKKRRDDMENYFGEEKNAELTGFLSLFYIKSVYSYLIDLFFPKSKPSCGEIRKIIENELRDPSFDKALKSATGSGIANKMTMAAARCKNVTISYLYAKTVYLLKYKMQRLFWKLK